MMRKFIVLGLLGSLFLSLGVSNGLSGANGCATGSCIPDIDFNGNQNRQEINVTGFIKDLAKKAVGLLALPAEVAIDAIAMLVNLKITIKDERFASANLTCSQCTQCGNNDTLVTQLVVELKSNGRIVGGFGSEPQSKTLSQVDPGMVCPPGEICQVQNAQTLDSKALADAIFGNIDLFIVEGSSGIFGFESSSQGFEFKFSGTCTCVAGGPNTKFTCANKPIPQVSAPQRLKHPIPMCPLSCQFK